MDLVRADAGVFQRLSNDRLLRRPIGHCQTACRTILIDRGASDIGKHLILVRHAVRQPLEHNEAAAFTTAEPIRRRREGLAATVRREHATLGKVDARLRAQDQIDSAGDGQVTFAVPQALAGEVNGNQRRGAGGIDRQAGALKARL